MDGMVMVRWGALSLLMVLAGCEQKSGEASGPEAASAKVESSAATDGTASAEAPTKPAGAPAPKEPDHAAAAFFSGEPPSGVELVNGYVEDYPSFEYSLKLPASWRGSPGGGWEYMAMSKDATAAIFCDAMGNDESFSLGSLVDFNKIEALAKRAPAMAKDLVEDGSPVEAKVGARGYPARVGHAVGKLFGEEGGDVYWIDIRHQQPEGPWHMFCVGAIKKSAGEEVLTEAKAILRSLEPPRGKQVLEPKMDG